MVTAQATAAQWGFNAALLSCPILWIIAGIIAFVVVVFVAVAAVNKFSGTSLTVLRSNCRCSICSSSIYTKHNDMAI
ncbi:hypothetical protein ACK2GQ_16225 [Clostridioides difficile]